MPRHGEPTTDFSLKQRKAIQLASRALRAVVDRSLGADQVEEQILKLLMAVGRDNVKAYLEDLSERESFEEAGVEWRVAHRDVKKFMTFFGWVTVERPLFRAKRNGPTRCLVSERAGLFQNKWTPRAAKVAALATAELPFGRAESLFRELGGMAPSATLLQRLDRNLLDLWETERDRHDQRVRQSCPIPDSAVTVVVSLDGVMVNMVGSTRTEQRAQALAVGRPARGMAGYKEAAVGVISLYDAAGLRIATWRMARMPEANKKAVKDWIRAELQWVREKRPGIRVVAAADGAAPNWTFLQSLEPDLEVVDYFHTVEHLSHELSKACGAWRLETNRALADAKRVLLEEKDGARRVSARLERARRVAGTQPPSLTKKTGKRQPTYFQRHRDRMNYADLRAVKVPIGTGVTEGTCRHLVIDRLRRSGMTWSESGGQAVLNLRALVVSDRFNVGWASLMVANAQRLKRCA